MKTACLYWLLWRQADEDRFRRGRLPSDDLASGIEVLAETKAA
jgi:hypothetical protein